MPMPFAATFPRAMPRTAALTRHAPFRGASPACRCYFYHRTGPLRLPHGACSPQRGGMSHVGRRRGDRVRGRSARWRPCGAHTSRRDTARDDALWAALFVEMSKACRDGPDRGRWIGRACGWWKISIKFRLLTPQLQTIVMQAVLGSDPSIADYDIMQAVLGSAPSIADECHAGGSRVRSLKCRL